MHNLLEGGCYTQTIIFLYSQKKVMNTVSEFYMHLIVISLRRFLENHFIILAVPFAIFLSNVFNVFNYIVPIFEKLYSQIFHFHDHDLSKYSPKVKKEIVVLSLVNLLYEFLMFLKVSTLSSKTVLKKLAINLFH